jgi:hypothetical protein
MDILGPIGWVAVALYPAYRADPDADAGGRFAASGRLAAPAVSWGLGCAGYVDYAGLAYPTVVFDRSYEELLQLVDPVRMGNVADS